MTTFIKQHGSEIFTFTVFATVVTFLVAVVIFSVREGFAF